ncbi:MAG: AAA family ATPase, partial [Burkholderiales bacterium]|nr:AAA family ATPase [Burkholderiales bacterium]
MLRALSLRDFVIVEALDIELATGFTALTGETGAGKSILVDALGLVLGARAEPAAIRAGADRADIAAEFDLGGAPAARAWLAANDLEDEGGDSCLLRRTIDRAGRSRGFVNGRPATAAQLRDLGELLVDIHGQHEHQWLARRDYQRQLLDAFAGCE